MSAKKWYHYLSSAQRPLALQSLTLLKQQQALALKQPQINYDFVVFPLAKAYEAYLKDYLFHLGLVSEATYRSKKFSLGRSLNPDVRLEQRDEVWLYDDLARRCSDKIAREIWETWLQRNRLFHLYPGQVQTTTLEEAESVINQFIRVIGLCATC